MVRKVVYFCLLILLAACEPGDLVDLPKAPFRITILSFNQVGQPWHIIVAPTINFPHASGVDLKNASVKIYDNGSLVEELTYDTLTELSLFDVRVFKSTTNSPEVGHQYKIIVECDGLPTATAEYIQPQPVPADISFELREKISQISPRAISDGNTIIYTQDTMDIWTFDVTFKFTDPPGENFYDFWIANSETEDGLNTPYNTFNTGQGYLQTEVSLEPDYILGGAVRDDHDISEKEVTIKFVYTIYESTFPGMELEMPTWFRISLRTMTREQYRYLVQSRKSLLSQYDPYAQPVTTFTNVQNGLGIFGGYSPTSKIFRYEFE